MGLATTTALAPKSFASQAMGLWWLSVATGQGVAGFVIAQTEDAFAEQSEEVVPGLL